MWGVWRRWWCGADWEHRSRQTFLLRRCHVIYVMWRSWRWDRRWGVGVGWAGLRGRPCCQVEVEGGRGRRGRRRMLWRRRQVPLNVYEQNICRRIPQIGEAASRDLGKKKSWGEKKKTDASTFRDGAFKSKSFSRPSQWMVVSLYGYTALIFPQSLNHPNHRDSTVKSSGSGSSNDTGETPPTERHATSACRLGGGVLILMSPI